MTVISEYLHLFSIRHTAALIKPRLARYDAECSTNKTRRTSPYPLSRWFESQISQPSLSLSWLLPFNCNGLETGARRALIHISAIHKESAASEGGQNSEKWHGPSLATVACSLCLPLSQSLNSGQWAKNWKIASIWTSDTAIGWLRRCARLNMVTRHEGRMNYSAKKRSSFSWCVMFDSHPSRLDAHNKNTALPSVVSGKWIWLDWPSGGFSPNPHHNIINLAASDPLISFILPPIEVFDDGPFITGMRDRYELDEVLDADCTAPTLQTGHPADSPWSLVHRLTWYFNEAQVSTGWINRPQRPLGGR